MHTQMHGNKYTETYRQTTHTHTDTETHTKKKLGKTETARLEISH